MGSHKGTVIKSKSCFILAKSILLKVKLSICLFILRYAQIAFNGGEPDLRLGGI